MPKLIEILRDAAPALGSAMTIFGGPVGSAASAILTDVLGVPKDADEKAIEKALASATPEQLLALRKADADFQMQMAQVDLQTYEATLGDIANARSREMALHDKTPMFMASGVLAGFFSIISIILILILVKNEVIQDPFTASIVSTILTFVSIKADQVLTYYFGSSSGSKAKHDQMAGMLENSKYPAPAKK